MTPSGFGGMQNNMSGYGNPNPMRDQPSYLNPGNSKKLFDFFY